MRQIKKYQLNSAGIMPTLKTPGYDKDNSNRLVNLYAQIGIFKLMVF